MKQDESKHGGGLLSRMAKLVRKASQGADASPSGDTQADPLTQHSRHMLKEVVEAKRRNDHVRKREFAKLRELRQNNPASSSVPEELASDSVFDSHALTDERARTMRKIDVIEDQMSQQWWKSQDASSSSSATVSATTCAVQQPAASSPQERAGLRAGPPSTLFPHTQGKDSLAFAWTPQPPVPAEGLGANPSGAVSTTSGAANPEPNAQAVAAYVHEPELEEAAIVFANGDTEGAESALRSVLEQHRQDEPAQQLEFWMTLFDLYRAAGLQERFDELALDYAALYSRSSPLWFSMPAQLGLAVQDMAQPPAPPAQRAFTWNAPGTLSARALVSLQGMLAHAAAPWVMNWSRLTAIDTDAVPLLAEQVEQWSERQLSLVFLGAGVLTGLLETMTQPLDQGSSPDWWRLRMALLRLMGRMEDFENVAIDYCVTYEVSPPTWAPPVCSYLDGEDESALDESDDSAWDEAQGTADANDAADTAADTAAAVADAPTAAALSGRIEGDALPALRPLEGLLRPGEPLDIDCARLIRIDFVAAGSVLNWAAQQQARGYVVRFNKLHRLVAVFFRVVGIHEHAVIVPRQD